jgi:DNA-directed RNA polymerase beta' subunit
MWIIQYLPEIVVHLIFAAGLLGIIAGFLLSFIPSIKPYKLAIQVISLLVFTLGVYLQGALEDTKIWQKRVLELEVKVKEAELKSAQVNTVIQEKVVTKTQVVKEKAKEITKYVDRYTDREVLKEIPGPERVRVEEVIKYVERCSLPQDIVDAHNKAIDELNAAGKKK